MRIGLITDTHLPAALKRLWPEVHAAFAGVDLIWHGGDIVRPGVLDELEEIAPTFAARGNNDVGWTDPRLAHTQWLDVHGVRLAMVHDMEPEDEPIDELCRMYLGGRRADVIVTGHTHFERMDFRDGVLQVNTGSAVHPHLWSTRLGTVGIIEVGPGGIRAEILRLGESQGLRNPGVGHRFDGNTVQRLDAAPDSTVQRLDAAPGGTTG
jgi:putative phosphoesterase